MTRSICTCKGCNARIIWMITDALKMIPVDYKPELDMIDKFDPKTMISHFATCKKADSFRHKIKEKKK